MKRILPLTICFVFIAGCNSQISKNTNYLSLTPSPAQTPRQPTKEGRMDIIQRSKKAMMDGGMSIDVI
ncbi:MAG TPA: hypothetical protein VGD05_03425, partial [Pyrinomonadaceae bacterium]